MILNKDDILFFISYCFAKTKQKFNEYLLKIIKLNNVMIFQLAFKFSYIQILNYEINNVIIF